MTRRENIAFGLPSIPRQTMPSMFQILSWPSDKPKETQISPQQIDQKQQGNYTHQIKQNQPNFERKTQQNVIQNTSEVRSQYSNQNQQKLKSKSLTKHHQLYQYKENPLKRAHSQVRCDVGGSKISLNKKIQPVKKILDPNSELDKAQIEARKERIKKFQLVTRDLPNSAFTTYYGKPAFEAYGRGNSSQSLLTHNVMPHKGSNHPKKAQSYYSALLKGKRSISTTHVPRKPIEQKVIQIQLHTQQQVNIPIEKPDLINNIRFTASDPREKHNQKIPSNKFTPLKQKAAKKSTRKQIKRKEVAKSKVDAELEDGLKYMNSRENLIEIMNKKKLNSSKLAYKVTDCYPYEWQNEQKLKQSTKLWEKVKTAGQPSKKGEKVGQIIQGTKQKGL